MKKSIFAVLLLSSILAACECGEETKPVSKGGQFVPVQEQKADQKPEEPGCEIMPKMTNDQRPDHQ